jgi:hypothetical protein
LATHFAASEQDPQDALYHQQQATLRNASDPETGFCMSVSLFWSWRSRAKHAFWRILVLFYLSTICLLGFSAASLFSSRISSIVGTEVLLSGHNCSLQGTYANFADQTSDPYDVYYVPHQVLRTTQIENAANYALQCYANNSANQLDCGTFVQKRLPINVQMNASCPFNSTICKSQDKNLFLDTGYLDSHQHFGINAPASERFLYRKVLHCAPLVTEGYKSKANDSNGHPVTRYFYENSPNRTRYTYQYSNNTADTLLSYTLE